MTNLFTELQPRVTGTIKSMFRTHPDVDDVVQEALIRLWKDVEGGNEDTKHLYRRAITWGKAFVYDDHHSATGTPARSREGITRTAGNKSRERIKEYLETNPDATNKQIGEALSLHEDTVWNHRKKMKTDNIKVIVRQDADGRNRMDRNAYKVLSTNVEGDAGDYFRDHVDSIHNTPSHETAIVNNMAMLQMVASLKDPDQREAVYRHYWNDEGQTDIAKDLGVWQAAVRRRLLAAHKELKKVLDQS